jgi:HEAT repeat protein
MIASQLKGWVSEARIILTCRLNVWDVGKNDLYTFEKYRIQQLSYPDMVDTFIRRFFFKAGEPTKGENLIEKLERSQPRIRDLVKNPLRLTLLCRTWKRRQGELPQTKAELYKGFVETFYEWKDKPEIAQEKRPLLEQALGELAKNAIDKETTKFRLRESFVRQELDKFDKSLFDLACRVSWINNVGVAAENSDESVYAFFHPTFQEYFAALAIDDWDFFLPRAHDNRNPKPVSERYRIFEPQWKEVILLWLGREKVAKEQKKNFIETLVKFKDACGNFYWHRAYFLAAAGIAEFGSCDCADEIVKKIVKWGFGYFNFKKSRWQKFHYQIAHRARVALKETDKKKVIASLIDLLPTIQDEYTRWQTVLSLREIDKDNPEALQTLTTLIRLVQTSENKPTPMLVAVSLGEIAEENSEALQALIRLVQTAENEVIRRQAAQSLGEIAKDNSEAIQALIELLRTAENEYTRWLVARSLEKISKDNLEAIQPLVVLVQTAEDDYTRQLAASVLGEIAKDNPEAIQALIELVQTTENEYTRRQAAQSLGEIAKDSPEAIQALIELVQTAKDDSTRQLAAASLWEIDKGNSLALQTLIDLVQTAEDESARRLAAASLAKIDKGNLLAREALIELIQTAKDDSTRRLSAVSLAKIDKGNSLALQTLIGLVQTTENESTRQSAAASLGEIGKGNLEVFQTLIKLVQTAKDDSTRRLVAASLREISKGNPEMFHTLIELVQTAQDKFTRLQAAASLRQIIRGNGLRLAVSGLKSSLANQVKKNDFDRYFYCYEVLWHCAQNMTYPDFYQAWHHQEEVEKTTTSDRQSLNQADFPQSLQSAIANDPQLSQIIHLICIDGSQFIEPDRPAAEIYDQMLDQHCPECDRVPETMPALKLYWNSLKRKSDKRVVLVFYASSTNPYNEAFLTDLSKFKGDICIVTSPPAPLLRGEGSKSGSGSPSSLQGEPFRGWGSLQFFAPSQAIADVLKWIRASAPTNLILTPQ